MDNFIASVAVISRFLPTLKAGRTGGRRVPLQKHPFDQKSFGICAAATRCDARFVPGAWR
jgi:hypothetical protein